MPDEEKVKEQRDRVGTMTGEDLRDDEFLEESVETFAQYEGDASHELSYSVPDRRSVSPRASEEARWLVPELRDWYDSTAAISYDGVSDDLMYIAEQLVQPGVLDVYEDPAEEELDSWSNDRHKTRDGDERDKTVSCSFFGKLSSGSRCVDSILEGDNVFKTADSVVMSDSHVSGDHVMQSVPGVRLDGSIVDGTYAVRNTDELDVTGSVLYSEAGLETVGEVSLDHSFVFSEYPFQDQEGEVNVYNSVIVAGELGNERSRGSIRNSVVVIKDNCGPFGLRDTYVIGSDEIRYYDETGSYQDASEILPTL